MLKIREFVTADTKLIHAHGDGEVLASMRDLPVYFSELID
jgi:hypothetical protein